MKMSFIGSFCCFFYLFIFIYIKIKTLKANASFFISLIEYSIILKRKTMHNDKIKLKSRRNDKKLD